MSPPVLTQELIQDLKDWTTRLFEVADRTLAAVELKEDDHLGFMATLFLRKQVEHLRSIHALLPRKDVVLVARSMVEGLCQLLWAQQKPERAWRWRAFAYVHDWRLQNLRARQGIRPDPARRDKIEDALRELGDSFLTKKAKRAKDSGCDLPEDPYQKHWRVDFNLLEFCKEHDVERLYTEAYDPFSDWHHWGVDGLGAAIQRVEGQIVYKPDSLNDCAVSLTAAFQCLFQTVQVADKWFHLGMGKELMDLRAGFLEYHRTAPQEPLEPDN